MRPGKIINANPYEQIPELKLEDPVVSEGTNRELISELIKFIAESSPPKSTGYLVATNTLLLVNAAISALLYIEPSISYGNRQGSQTEMGLQVFGNTVSAAIVTWNVTRIYFFDFKVKIKELRLKLSPFLDADRLKRESRETIPLLLTSFISAGPLSIPAYQFSSELSEGLRIAKAIGVQVAYTGNHTFPVYLLMYDPLTRKVMLLPFLPFIYFRDSIQYCRSTPEMLNQQALREQTKRDHAQLKMAMTQTFTTAIRKIINSSTTFESKKLEYVFKFSSQITELAQQKQLTLDHYLLYLEIAKQLPAPSESGRAEKWLRRFAWAIGATTMTVGVSGFVLSVYNQAKKWTDNSAAAIAITTIPAYITAVITVYFGGNRLQTVSKEVPLAIKLYPKSAALLLAVSGFICWYGSGTAAETVYQNTEPGPVQDVLVEFALQGVRLFGSANLLDFVFFLTTKYAKRWGTDDEKMAVRLGEQAERLALAVDWLDGQQLETALKDLSGEQRQKFCGLPNTEFNQLIDHKQNLNKSLIQNTERHWFLCNRKSKIKVPQEGAPTYQSFPPTPQV